MEITTDWEYESYVLKEDFDDGKIWDKGEAGIVTRKIFLEDMKRKRQMAQSNNLLKRIMGKVTKTFDPDKILPIKNNKLPDNEKTGVILCGGINNFTPEGWEIFKLSELFSLCEITSDPKIEDTTCLSFPFNATPLCKTIQYLAKLFNCPLDKIEITIEDPNATTNVNTSNSDSNGCFGMLALMISIGGAGIYGLIELASKLII